MMLREPDPEFISSARAQQNFLLAVRVATWVLVVVWVIFALTMWWDGRPLEWGLRPRQPSGLIGIVTAPLLHVDVAHLFANSAPLWVGLVALLFLYPNSALRALPWMWLISGGLTWLLARESIHVGASGMVYAILSFVFVAGLLRRDLRAIGVCLMLAFVYGYLIWGVFPIRSSMSWEMHAFGLLAGVALALVYRDWDQTPVKVYDWEHEDCCDDDVEFEGGDGDAQPSLKDRSARWAADGRNEVGGGQSPPSGNGLD